MSFLHRVHLLTGPSLLTELTRVDQAASSTGTVIMPTGVRQAGDVLVFCSFAQSTTSEVTPSYSNPSGWTQLINNTVAIQFSRIGVSYKISNGTETGAISGIASADSNRSMIIVLRPVGRGIASLGSAKNFASQYAGPGSGGTSFSLTSSSGTAPTLCFGLYYSYSPNITTRGFSPAKDDEYNSTGIFYTAWKTYVSGTTPANHTVSASQDFVLIMKFYSDITLA